MFRSSGIAVLAKVLCLGSASSISSSLALLLNVLGFFLASENWQ